MRFLLNHFCGTCAGILELWVIRINNGRHRRISFAFEKRGRVHLFQGTASCVVIGRPVRDDSQPRLLQSAQSHSQLPSCSTDSPTGRGGPQHVLCQSWNLDRTPPSVSRTQQYEAVRLLPGLHLAMTVNHDCWKSSGPSYHLGVLPSDISLCDEEVMETNVGVRFSSTK